MNIYVGNIPYGTDEETIGNLFKEYGEVHSVKLIKDYETGKLKGFGFVEMEQTGGHKAIEELNDYELEDKNLVVNEARQRRERRSNFNSNRRY